MFRLISVLAFGFLCLTSFSQAQKKVKRFKYYVLHPEYFYIRFKGAFRLNALFSVHFSTFPPKSRLDFNQSKSGSIRFGMFLRSKSKGGVEN